MASRWPDGFAPAAAAETMRASQKDHFYVHELGLQLKNVLLGFFEARHVDAYADELRACAALGYFGITLIRNGYTLGDEYCDITRIQANNGRAAGFRRRLIYVLVQALAPYMYARLSSRLIAKMQRTDPSESTLLHALVPRLEELREAAETMQLAHFCLGGRFLGMADRASGLVPIRHSAQPPPSTEYRLIGVLLTSQLVLASASALLRWRAARAARLRLEKARSTAGAQLAEDITRQHAEAQEGARLCSLCLAPRRAPTAGSCGHIFCWDCFHEWVASRPECPLCRTTLTHQSLRCLHGYK